MTIPLVRVGEIAEQVRGVSYDKQDAAAVRREGYLPVLRAGNITDDGLTFSDLVFVPADRISARQRIQRGDVLVAASSGSLDVVGKAAPAGRRRLRARAKTSAGQFNINTQGLGAIEIPLPPLARQHDFSQRLRVIGELRRAHEVSRSRLDSLFATLQQRAFRGEL